MHQPGLEKAGVRIDWRYDQPVGQTIEAPEQFGVNDPDILTAIRLHKIMRVRQHCSAEEWDLFERRSRGQAFQLR